MVRHLIVQAIITVGKSVFQAYKNVSKGGPREAASNPMSDWLKSTMQATNIIHTPMTQEEAIKILNIEEFPEEEHEKIDQIMKAYVRLFNKNNQILGGSPYLQSKYYNAKDFLMKDQPDLENQWFIDNNIDPESLKSTLEEEDQNTSEQKDEKKDEKKEEKKEGKKEEKQ